MKFLITGSAGFIGMHVSKRLLELGHAVLGIDSLNDYYDVGLKNKRNQILESYQNFLFVKGDISDKPFLMRCFEKHCPDIVINLAAQAGVRYSIENPDSYVESNLCGFVNILECCRAHSSKHLVYASSSSVYGLNNSYPFEEDSAADYPVALYGATKRANELLAHSYSHLFGLPTTGLRFFTVYGPWGRPDMALFKFTRSILHKQPIDVYNNGDMTRDFTFVDDVAESVCRVAEKIPSFDAEFDFGVGKLASSSAPWKVFNVGKGKPTPLMHYIKSIERKLGVRANINFMSMQPGDVIKTYASTKKLEDWIGYQASVDVEDGVSKFVDWYLEFYGDLRS